MKTAIEFYSGIGAFAAATWPGEVEIKAAFDQSSDANSVYEYNFKFKPCARNLDNIKARDIPEADIWWLSPPCKPFTVRGNQKDDKDPRAASLLNLIKLIPEHQPGYVLLENVLGFSGSAVHNRLKSTLVSNDYRLAELQICPTLFGIPMKRPRLFLVGAKNKVDIAIPDRQKIQPVSDYLKPSAEPGLLVDPELINRYERSLNIVDASSQTQVLICITSNYWKSMKAAGSLIRNEEGTVRRLSPAEILYMLGFHASFAFPPAIDLRTAWRLAGNSVDIHSIRYILSQLGILPCRADRTPVNSRVTKCS